MNTSISEAIIAIIARPTLFKEITGTHTLTPITDLRWVVSLTVPTQALWSYHGAKITSDGTKQLIRYIDVQQALIPQRSGGLEKNKEEDI